MSLLDDIKSKTGMDLLGDGTVRTFTNRPVIRTPIKVVDTLIGGGIPLGAMVDLFGPKGSGKSSYGYEVFGNFQKQYPDGLSVLIDSESSVEPLRMKALGVDPSRLLVLRGATMESGYRQILTILKTVAEEKPKNRVPVCILWDSLSSTSTDAQASKENVNGGGLAEAARVNKEFLKQINQYLGDVDALIIFINQVSNKIGMFVGSGWNEAGGNALQHAFQYKLEFSANKPTFENGIAVRTEGGVRVVKNKMGPVTQDYPVSFDNTKGGTIDVVRSAIYYLLERYMMEKNRRGRWSFYPQYIRDYPLVYQFVKEKYPKLLGGATTWDNVVEAMEDDYYNDKGIFFDFMILKWADVISSTYVLQREVIAPYAKELRDKIDAYFKEKGWSTEVELPDEFKEGNENKEDDGDDQ